MPQEFSFDIESKPNLQELDNAMVMAMKEIANRFDFKGSISSITRENDALHLVSDDEFKLKTIIDILQTKLIKRGISLKFLEYGKVDNSLGGGSKQDAKIKSGIPQEQAKKINVMIRDSGLKVRSIIQADQLRVSGKAKDDLQAVMSMLRKAELPIELQFTNYR
jgi:uncharacterized protein YajQ (UPF0234 family)